MGNRAAADAAARSVYRVYPLDPLPATQWDLAAWFVLGIAGLVVQLAVTAKGKEIESRIVDRHCGTRRGDSIQR